MECSFHQIILPECSEAIVISGSLQSLAPYRWELTDKFGNKWKGTADTDEDGSITIDLTDFPPGMFTAYSGSFQVQAFAGEELLPAEFTFNGKIVTTVQISFIVTQTIEV